MTRKYYVLQQTIIPELHNWQKDVDYLSGEEWELVQMFQPRVLTTWVFSKEFRTERKYKNELKRLNEELLILRKYDTKRT